MTLRTRTALEFDHINDTVCAEQWSMKTCHMVRKEKH